MIKVEEWKPSEGLSLEPNALTAITELNRNVVLTAGPGAGKTEMLAQRADFLLRTNCAPHPQRILAIAFKVDASRNLRDRVRRRCGPLAERLDSLTFHAFAKRLIDRFRPVLKGQNALDADYTIGPQRVIRTQITFGDLVPLAVEILRNSEIARNAVRQTYSHVFLDEFQDCTKGQFELIEVAFGSTDILITAVGDTKQRIMGWAGALVGIVATYAARFNALPLNLYQNFRSLPLLRRMQNEMVKVMEPSAAVADAEIRDEGGAIEIREFGDSREEALCVASLISEWITVELIPPSDIAILVAKQIDEYAGLLTSELSRLQIPYRNEQQLQDVSAEPIASILVDFLLTVCCERRPASHERLFGFLSSGSDEEGHARWQQFIDRCRDEYAVSTFDLTQLRRMVEKFLGEIGPEHLASLSHDYERGSYMDDKKNEALLRIEQLWAQSGDLDEALSRFSEDRAVRIMTVHKSKGLEFDSVVFLAVEQETFWGKDEDERAVFFVGISRARRRLLLTHAQKRELPGTRPRRWEYARTRHREFLGYAESVTS